jgi:predicted methyltransferase
MRRLLIASTALLLAACSQGDVIENAADTMTDAASDAMLSVTTTVDSAKLQTVLAAQSDEMKARYEFRNPGKTLEFFEIAPGMSVGEALPGGGWYSRVLLPYLGEGGELVGVNYPMDLWPNFGWMTEERIAQMADWPTTWPEQAAEWTDSPASIDAYTFATLPADGSLDAFLFIRALHNLNRFEDGRFMGEALSAVHGALKPGGIVGVVQHEAPADADADWANGAAGYLKRADVIAAFEAAGFELVESSDINANPLDVPSSDDVVWRLKPSRRSEEGNEALRAELDAIGESNRMTLKFRKA